MTYKEYLKSPAWYALRQQALSDSGHCCRLCNYPHMLNVHHRKYPKVLGTEPVTDLIVLCSKCHKLFHEKLSFKRKDRNWQQVSRHIVFADGSIKNMIGTRPQFSKMQQDPLVAKVCTPAGYKRYLEKIKP